MKNIHETINNSIAAAKKMKSIEDWINKLSYKEQQYMETIINANVNENLKILADSVTNAITDFLYEHNFDVKAELDKLEVKINKENDMITKYLKRGEDYMNKLKKDKDNIIKDYEEMIKNKTDKEVIEELKFKYSDKFTATSIRNVVNEHKRNKLTDEDIEKAAESIFETEKVDKPSQSNLSKEKVKKSNNTLKIKSIVVEDEEGTEYVKENNTVKVGKMTFEDIKEVEEFRESSLKEYKEGHDNALSERRKQYEEEIAEINRAYEEEKIKFLKKINNIADVMAM